MSIWYMNGKTFLKKMIKNEKPDSVLRARYVVISTRIRVANRNRKKAILAKSLFPEARILADLGPICGEDTSERQYRNQLKEQKGYLAVLIKSAILKNQTFVFMCSETEWKVLGDKPFLKILAEFIYDEFGYPIYDYNKYKNGKDVKIPYNKNEVLKKCKKVIKHDRINYLNRCMKTKEGRRKMLKDMSTSEMRQLLDNFDIYSKDMTKKEMKTLLKDHIL